MKYPFIRHIRLLVTETLKSVTIISPDCKKDHFTYEIFQIDYVLAHCSVCASYFHSLWNNDCYI